MNSCVRIGYPTIGPGDIVQYARPMREGLGIFPQAFGMHYTTPIGVASEGHVVPFGFTASVRVARRA